MPKVEDVTTTTQLFGICRPQGALGAWAAAAHLCGQAPCSQGLGQVLGVDELAHGRLTLIPALGNNDLRMLSPCQARPSRIRQAQPSSRHLEGVGNALVLQAIVLLDCCQHVCKGRDRCVVLQAAQVKP